MNESQLPLFPLQVVLFPHAALPLHIYEERYRLLLRECIKEASEFGVVLAREENLESVGCSAAVTNVLQTYDDGRMDLLVEGRQRFRVRSIDREEKPWLMGSVEFFVEGREGADRQLAATTIGMYNELVRIVYLGRIKQLDPDCAESGLSFVMAQKAGLDLGQRQQLLQMDAEQDRMAMLHAYLRATLPRLKKLEEVERIIRSDGYIDNYSGSST